MWTWQCLAWQAAKLYDRSVTRVAWWKGVKWWYTRGLDNRKSMSGSVNKRVNRRRKRTAVISSGILAEMKWREIYDTLRLSRAPRGWRGESSHWTLGKYRIMVIMIITTCRRQKLELSDYCGPWPRFHRELPTDCCNGETEASNCSSTR